MKLYELTDEEVNKIKAERSPQKRLEDALMEHIEYAIPQSGITDIAQTAEALIKLWEEIDL